MVSKLTGKQKALLDAIPQELRRETALAYMASGYENKTKAYLKACKKMKRAPSKNPETSASEMLSYPNVLEFINSVKLEVAEEAMIDAAWVLASAKKVFDRCMQEEAIETREGEPTGQFKFEHSGANKALEIIGKHVNVQAFLDKSKVEHALTDDFDELMSGAASDED